MDKPFFLGNARVKARVDMAKPFWQVEPHPVTGRHVVAECLCGSEGCVVEVWTIPNHDGAQLMRSYFCKEVDAILPTHINTLQDAEKYLRPLRMC